MAQEVIQNPGFLPEGDGDVLTPEEIAAMEAEQQGKEPETPEPPVEPEKPVVPERRVPSEQNLRGEAQRLRAQRDRLRAENAEKDAERQRLLEENVRLRARRELEDEANKRLEEARQRSSRPDPEIDPVGAELYELREEAKANRALREKIEAQEKAQQQWQENQRQQFEQTKSLKEYLDSEVASYREANPDIDYDDASGYLYTQYTQYWQNYGGLAPQEAQALAANMYMALAQAGKEKGKSPSEAIVGMAKLVGWQPKAKETPPGKPVVPTKPNQEAAVKEKLARLKKAQAMQGLGGKDSSARTVTENMSELTAEDIDAMDDDAYVAMKQDKTLGPLLNKRLQEL